MASRKASRYVAVRDVTTVRRWLVVDLETRTVWAACKEEGHAVDIATALESAE